jgi:hypothetical protein
MHAWPVDTQAIKRSSSTRQRRTIRTFTDATFLASSILLGPQAAVATPLSKAAEEAKKPAPRREIPARASENILSQWAETSDKVSEVLELLSLARDVYSLARESYESAWDPTRPSRPPAAPPKPVREAAFYAALRSHHMQPPDFVLTRLDGAGIELGVLSGGGTRLGLGVGWLRGEIRADSPAFGGLTNPREFDVEARANFPFFAYSVMSMNWCTGIRGGFLAWDYANPVTAADDDGRSRRVDEDWLPTVSIYVGLGLTPLRTQIFEIGVDAGVGLRGYFTETHQGFQNDLFGDGVFTQFSIEMALHSDG